MQPGVRRRGAAMGCARTCAMLHCATAIVTTSLLLLRRGKVEVAGARARFHWPSRGRRAGAAEAASDTGWERLAEAICAPGKSHRAQFRGPGRQLRPRPQHTRRRALAACCASYSAANSGRMQSNCGPHRITSSGTACVLPACTCWHPNVHERMCIDVADHTAAAALVALLRGTTRGRNKAPIACPAVRAQWQACCSSCSGGSCCSRRKALAHTRTPHRSSCCTHSSLLAHTWKQCNIHTRTHDTACSTLQRLLLCRR